MEEIIPFIEYIMKNYWNLMIANWILCTLPIAFILYILVNIIKGSISK